MHQITKLGQSHCTVALGIMIQQRLAGTCNYHYYHYYYYYQLIFPDILAPVLTENGQRDAHLQLAPDCIVHRYEIRVVWR